MDSKALALIATVLALSAMVDTQSEITNKFESFKATHGKTYANEVEEAYRLSVYSSNIAEFEAHNNKAGVTYTKGENQFADLTNDEFRARYLMNVAPKRSNGVEFEGTTVSGSVNWVTKGAVQRVKNQGQCGSCWAFSTVAVSESQKFLSTGTIGDFSEQQLVSCDNNDGNNGCGGGWPYVALDYFAKNGFCTEESYSYTSGSGAVAQCQESSCTKDSFTISGHRNIAQSVSAVQSANDQQPVSVCVDASGWSAYSGGVFSDCTTTIDHAVLLAGYSGNDYFLIKNSWGASWGENGYIRLAGGGNTCGILNNAVIPTV